VSLAPSACAQALLDRAAGALPASAEETRWGWRLRFTDSSMWWVGSVLAHTGQQGKTLTAAVRAAEEVYAARGAPARFQVCPGCPDGLDAVLAGRGYQRHSPMALQVAATAQVVDRLVAPPLSVRVSDRPGADWFRIWQAVHAPGVDSRPEKRLLRRVGQPSGYVTVHAGGRPVAVGRVVADRGWAGVFGMATLPTVRGQGAGTAVLAALARWAADRDASRMYLQLDHGNVAAQRLYAAAGFTTLFSYHYRSQSA
jgi:N-acetylglutamate synthase